MAIDAAAVIAVVKMRYVAVNTAVRAISQYAVLTDAAPQAPTAVKMDAVKTILLLAAVAEPGENAPSKSAVSSAFHGTMSAAIRGDTAIRDKYAVAMDAAPPIIRYAAPTDAVLQVPIAVPVAAVKTVPPLAEELETNAPNRFAEITAFPGMRSVATPAAGVIRAIYVVTITAARQVRPVAAQAAAKPALSVALIKVHAAHPARYAVAPAAVRPDRPVAVIIVAPLAPTAVPVAAARPMESRFCFRKILSLTEKEQINE